MLPSRIVARQGIFSAWGLRTSVESTMINVSSRTRAAACAAICSFTTCASPGASRCRLRRSSVFFAKRSSSRARAMELSFTSCRACIPNTIRPTNFCCGLENRGEHIPRNPSSCSPTRWAIGLRFISASLDGVATFTMPVASWSGEAIFTCPAERFQSPQPLRTGRTTGAPGQGNGEATRTNHP